MIRTRFSPSPTGLLHLGNVRAALFSALYARKHEGDFIVRIEDTDAVRSEQKYVDQLQDDLHWLGIQWQEGVDVGGPYAPYRQSERHAIYDQYYKQLEKEGKAYPCFCSDQELALHRKLQLSRGAAPRYPGTCRKLSQEEIQKRFSAGAKAALRFQVPNDEIIEFVDIVKGLQRFSSDDIGDFIIRRQDGSSSFMFCNAIDDSLMQVTHVLRGEDHLTNTPRQLMILTALAMRTPQYGHLSLITGEDGAPLSKRHGSSSLNDLREEGFLPEATLNYLARLGHVYETNNLMTFSELAEHFQLEKLSRSPAKFDKNQLLHWQKEAVMALDFSAVEKWLGANLLNRIPAGKRSLFIEVMQKNIIFPHEAERWAHFLFTEDWVIDERHLPLFTDVGETLFSSLESEIEKNNDLKTALSIVSKELNLSGKRLYMPVRLALTGVDYGPELVHIASLLGKEKMIERFRLASSRTRR